MALFAGPALPVHIIPDKAVSSAPLERGLNEATANYSLPKNIRNKNIEGRMI